MFEQTEFFSLQGTITSNNTLNTSFVAIGTILDNDVAPSITMNDSRENEGVALSHKISISHPSSTPITIELDCDKFNNTNGNGFSGGNGDDDSDMFK